MPFRGDECVHILSDKQDGGDECEKETADIQYSCKYLQRKEPAEWEV